MYYLTVGLMVMTLGYQFNSSIYIAFMYYSYSIVQAIQSACLFCQAKPLTLSETLYLPYLEYVRDSYHNRKTTDRYVMLG